MMQNRVYKVANWYLMKVRTFLKEPTLFCFDHIFEARAEIKKKYMYTGGPRLARFQLARSPV